MRPDSFSLRFSLYALSGVATGLAGHAWPLAWVGMALFAYALGHAPSRRDALAGACLNGLVVRVLWLSWAWPMATAMTSQRGAYAAVVAAGFVVVSAFPTLLTVAILTLSVPPRLTFVGLPLAWAVGERLQERWTGMSNDWLFTQIDVRPVMGALAAYGMWPTVLLCLTAASAAGAFAAARTRPRGVLAVASMLGIVLAPALPPPALDKVVGIGAVHLRSSLELPAVDLVDADLSIVVWPEATLATRRMLAETTVAASRLDTPLGSPSSTHLVGAVTSKRRAAQNSALVIGPDATIQRLRAKRDLMLVFERSFLGVGENQFEVGQEVPLLPVAGRPVIPLICGELLSRELVSEGRAAGGQLLAVMAGDTYQAHHEVAADQVLRHVRLRAIEYRVPAVYSSRDGRSAIVADDGSVLARSDFDAPPGVLTWTPARGADDRRPPDAITTTLLYSQKSPELRADCQPGRCHFVAIEDFQCERADTTKTLIVAGHSAPPQYVGMSATALARIIGCFKQADLVVLDTCFGAAAELLSEVSKTTRALVVAAPREVSARGFHYGPALFSASLAAERARAVSTKPASTLFVGWPDADAIARTVARSHEASGDELRPGVRRWNPTLVAVEVEPGQEVVVEADWKKIGHPPTRD